MNVRQVGPNSWKVTVSYQGQRWYFTEPTEVDGQITWVNAMADLKAGKDPRDRYQVTKRARGHTVATWAPIWLEAQDFEPNWRAKVGRILDHDVIPRFGAVTFEDGFSRIEVRGWLTKLSTARRVATGRPLAAGTVAHIWGVFARLCADAVAEGLLERDPCAGLKPPKRPKTSAKRHYIETVDVVRLADILGTHRREDAAPTPAMRRRRVMTILLWGTGCRWSELGGLRRRPDEIDLMRRPPMIRVVEPAKTTGKTRYQSEPKTEAGKRTIQLIAEHGQLLAEVLALGGPFAFGTAADTPMHYEDYRLRFKEAAAELGHPEWTVHDLRHSHATLLRGCPRRAVQERLGHQPQDTTDVYTHVTDDDRAEILRVIAGAWRDALASGGVAGDLADLAGEAPG